MKLKISAYNSYSKTLLYVHCPQCDVSAEINLPMFLQAINLEKRFHCSDCGAYFMVKIGLLDSATELRNEAEAGWQICPQCKGTGYIQGVHRKYTCGKCNGAGQI